jgi:hypothetical protein
MENDKKEFFNDIKETYFKKEIAAGILNLNDEPKLVKLLYNELYQNSILRKNLEIHISFSENKDKIKEKQIWTYDLHNRSSVVQNHEQKYSTVDRKGMVRLTSFSYYIDDESKKFFVKIPKIDSSKIYNKHSVFIKIPPNSSATVSISFEINFPYQQNFYMNDIGILKTTIKSTIYIEKPKGYLFSIDTYTDDNFLSVADVTTDFDNRNKTELKYAFPGALFAGTGIEYMLEKV